MAFDGTDFPPKDESGGGEPLPEKPATKWRQPIETHFVQTPMFSYAMRHEDHAKKTETWHLVFIDKEPFPGVYTMTINALDEVGNYQPIFHDTVEHREHRFHGYGTGGRRDAPSSLGQLLRAILTGLGYDLSHPHSWTLSETPLVDDDCENISVDGRLYGHHRWYCL
jgi:hypothetical protein